MEQIFMLVIMVCFGLALMLVGRDDVTASAKKNNKNATREQQPAASGMPELILSND